MSAESNFGELFCRMIEQFQLSPSVARLLLQRILEILSEESRDAPDTPPRRKESEETDL